MTGIPVIRFQSEHSHVVPAYIKYVPATTVLFVLERGQTWCTACLPSTHIGKCLSQTRQCVRTFRTFSISVISTFLANFFMSTFPPPPSPSSSSPSSSRFTPPSAPSPPTFLSLPQNSTNEFSCNISLNASRASVVRVSCQLSNSCSSWNTSQPNFVAGSEDRRDETGSEVNCVASEGLLERKSSCKLSKCFVRSWLTCA